MPLRTPEQLLQDIRELVPAREPMIRAQLSGKPFFLNPTFATKQDREYSLLIWILPAQIGTLDKLADSDEAGHAFQSEAGHLFQREAGRDSDLKPATKGSFAGSRLMMSWVGFWGQA
jgi:hypothetical protein